MDAGLVAAWVASGSSLVGVLYLIIKNGVSQARRDKDMKTTLCNELKAIKTELDDPDNGLRAIAKLTHEMKERCIGTHSALNVEIANMKKEINRYEHMSD